MLLLSAGLLAASLLVCALLPGRTFLVAVANVIAGAIQRRQLDQRHELMIRELRHRSGNLFAQLLLRTITTTSTTRAVQ